MGMASDYYWCSSTINGLHKMSSLDDSQGVLCLCAACLWAILGYQTNVLYWLACWIGNIAMVVIGVGYLSYFSLF